MVSKANSEKLAAALAVLVERRRSEDIPLTIAEVCRISNVSRHTAMRDQAFRRSLSVARENPCEMVCEAGAPARPPREERLRNMRRTIDRMANLIQVLSIAFEDQERELRELRAKLTGEKVVTIVPPARAARGYLPQA